MKPEGVDFFVDGADVAEGDGAHDDADEDGDPYARTTDAEGTDHVHVGQSADEHQHDGEDQDGGVECHDEQDVGLGHLTR